MQLDRLPAVDGGTNSFSDRSCQIPTDDAGEDSFFFFLFYLQSPSQRDVQDSFALAMLPSNATLPEVTRSSRKPSIAAKIDI